MPRMLFQRAHYNIIAAQIREHYPDPLDYGDSRAEYLSAGDKVTNLAISLAKRFLEDNPNFNPVMFLNACSPNTDLYPLGEFWPVD